MMIGGCSGVAEDDDERELGIVTTMCARRRQERLVVVGSVLPTFGASRQGGEARMTKICDLYDGVVLGVMLRWVWRLLSIQGSRRRRGTLICG